jgi:hypothetical protein
MSLQRWRFTDALNFFDGVGYTRHIQRRRVAIVNGNEGLPI